MIDSDGAVRCDSCRKMLALKLEGKLTVVCPRCKRYHQFDTMAYNESDGYISEIGQRNQWVQSVVSSNKPGEATYVHQKISGGRET